MRTIGRYSEIFSKFVDMKDNKPYWRKLLEYQVEKRNTGFTIPFLIGAKRHIEGQNLLTIEELINEIINYEDVSALFYCNGLKEFTITTLPNIIKTPKEYYKLRIGNLIICTTELLKGIDEIKYIIETLELDYQKHIDKGEFDKNDGVWTDYIKENREMIKDVIK